MINVTPLQMLTLWEELMSCLYADNGFGTTVAEIYLFRLMPHSPLTASGPPYSDDAKEDYAEACRSLYDLCRLFEQRMRVELELEGGFPLDLLIGDPKNPFTHRVHIGVKKEFVRKGRA